MMRVKFFKSSDKNVAKFLLSNAYPEFANALRRALISEVPVMAISRVSFSKNNSALYNEMLALRLGLLSIISDAKTYGLPDGCTCKSKGCAKCTAKFSLEVKGPGTVYARDLKPVDSKIKPVHPDTPLVKLFEGQEVRLEASAVLGYGSNHARFSGSMASYQYYPKITTGDCKCKVAVSACPKNVLDVKGGKVIVKSLDSCDLCLACVDACSCGKLRVEGNPNKFIFTLESWGQYEPKEMVRLAVKQLLERSKEFSGKVLK